VQLLKNSVQSLFSAFFIFLYQLEIHIFYKRGLLVVLKSFFFIPRQNGQILKNGEKYQKKERTFLSL
jgi:hypothetical protein